MGRTGWAFATLLLLSGCGSTETEPEATGEVPDGQGVAATDEVASKDAGPKMFALKEAMETDMFGLKIGMTPEQVRQELTKNGFAPPPRDEWGSKKKSLGIECDYDPSRCDVGRVQPNPVLPWRRPATDQANTPETIMPLFFVDTDGRQRLLRVNYLRRYEPQVDKANVTAAMAERFGQPTKGSSSNLTYTLELPRPSEYPAAGTQNRFHQEINRHNCLQLTKTSLVNEGRIDAPEECPAILKGNAEAQRMYDGINGTSNFLEIVADGRKLVMTLSGEVLGAAAKELADEERTMARISERLEASKRKVDAPAGL